MDNTKVIFSKVDEGDLQAFAGIENDDAVIAYVDYHESDETEGFVIVVDGKETQIYKQHIGHEDEVWSIEMRQAYVVNLMSGMDVDEIEPFLEKLGAEKLMI